MNALHWCKEIRSSKSFETMDIRNYTSIGLSQQENYHLLETTRLRTNPNRFSELLLATIIAFLFCRYIYRIYFHKLSGIPGPKLAAATHLYEAYFNLIGDGYFKKLIPMHKKYSWSTYYIYIIMITKKHQDSPVVRIATDHVHVGDPMYYHAYDRPQSLLPIKYAR